MLAWGLGLGRIDPGEGFGVGGREATWYYASK